MLEPVKIDSIPTCSDCNYAKRYFKEHNIVGFEENLSAISQLLH